MKLLVGEKEYTIKFGYKPVIKGKLLSKLANVESAVDEDEISGIEEMLAFVPEMILIGLQTHHSDEFGYDYNTNEGYAEKLESVFDLVDRYFETNKDADFEVLFSSLENELLENGFFANLFHKEVAEQKKTTKTTSKKKN